MEMCVHVIWSYCPAQLFHSREDPILRHTHKHVHTIHSREEHVDTLNTSRYTHTHTHALITVLGFGVLLLIHC